MISLNHLIFRLVFNHVVVHGHGGHLEGNDPSAVGANVLRERDLYEIALLVHIIDLRDFLSVRYFPGYLEVALGPPGQLCSVHVDGVDVQNFVVSIS